MKITLAFMVGVFLGGAIAFILHEIASAEVRDDYDD